jgi:hypothetical protein
VLFDTVPGTHVAVAASSRLFVVTPITPLSASSPAGSVDVTVRNIDENGDVIPGETVTVADGYAYEMPDLNARPECDLVRMARTLLHQFKKQVLQNTSISVHTDWSDQPSSGLTAIAEVPALVLIGPDLRENRLYGTNETRYEDNTFGLGSDFFEGLRPPRTVDLLFDLVGVTDKKFSNLALQSEAERFFERNKYIQMDVHPTDPAQGSEQWEMDVEPDGEMSAIGSPNNSNIHAFRGRFGIRGFDLDDASMATLVTRNLEDQSPEGSVVTPSAVVIETTERMGTIYLIGPSPGDD